MQQNKSQFKRLMKLVELIRDTKHPVNGLILNTGVKGTGKQRQDAAGISRCMDELRGFLGMIA